MSLGEVYGFVVFNCKIDPDYFLDEMSPDEVGYLSDSYIKDYREKWEMLRMQNHAVISSQATKKVELTDIMAFHWDSDNVEQRSEEDDIKARDRIKKKYNL